MSLHVIIYLMAHNLPADNIDHLPTNLNDLHRSATVMT
jgi:hypothetical protein